ncbi:TonB-dependent receptor domain-containing protein [Dyadobacter subterraneus]|uniref:TonB-dependent receptor n=1 Tax=Dyadobacter subterraneus TaxID=2773304 RepID=A0ABR9WCY0_9BACT|nr:TonB-dependent receptor [Dyadobacter subterraneus]MBE9463333.1 TonB-dependent receptor [Dyadobacter subterraneus]
MKSLVLNLLFLVLAQNALGQVTGKFVSQKEEPIPFATVLLLNPADSSLVKGSLTNETGDFVIENASANKYLLRFTAVGFQTWTSGTFELTDEQLTKNFGTSVIQEDTRQLGEVVIKAEKPLFEQKIEGMVVNVENSILTKGSSALSVLERAPGVVIDHRNSSISLNGKEGVMVMINGKLMRMALAQVVALLNSTNASDIEKIELLTSPPSRYDADGNAGLINIVMKKNKDQGTSGSITLTGGYGYREKAMAGFNLSKNTGKISTYGSYSFSHDRTYSYMYITSNQNMPVLGGRIFATVYDTTRSEQNNHNATAGIDYRINPKMTLGGNISYNASSSSPLSITRASYNVLPDSILLYHGQVSGNNHWKTLNSSVYIEKEIRAGEKVNFDLDYLRFKYDSPTIVNSSFLNPDGTRAGTNDSLFAPIQRGFAETSINVGVFKSDYSKSITKKIKIETGVKQTYSDGKSLSGIKSLVDGQWVNRSETSNQINMKESISAGYVSVNTQPDPTINLNFGTRVEYSHTHMDDPKTEANTIDRRLGKFFPNMSFSKKFDEDNELQFSYAKRISRPTYTDLASYVAYSDPTAVYTGNPLLKPTITDNIKLGYNYRNLAFSILYSQDKNPIARYQITQRPQANLLYISPQNLDFQKNITFQASLPLKINDWWSMNYGFVGAWRKFKISYTLVPVEKTYLSYSTNFSQLFKLPKNFSMEISGWYNSSFYNGSIKMRGFGMLNAGIKKTLKGNGGSFQFSVSDILRTMQINNYYGTLTTEAFSIKNHVTFNTESRVSPIFKLTYFRTFGGNNNKIRQASSPGSKDEADRLKNN